MHVRELNLHFPIPPLDALNDGLLALHEINERYVIHRMEKNPLPYQPPESTARLRISNLDRLMQLLIHRFYPHPQQVIHFFFPI